MSSIETSDMITVIIPAYNGARFVEDALKSVFAQSIPPDEVIVIDDCSTDNTLQVLELYKDKINIVKNKVNSGASFSRNQGILRAKSEFIAFLDADDIWHPQKIEQQLQILSANKSCLFTYGNAKLVDIKSKSDMHFDSSDILDEQYKLKNLKDVFQHPYFSTSTIVVNRTLALNIDKFREDLQTAEDVDFVLKAAAKTDVIESKAILSLTRRVENSLGSIESSYQDNLDVIDSFIHANTEFAIHNKALVNSIKRKIFDDWVSDLIFKRKIDKALKVSFRSLKKANISRKTIVLICKSLILKLRFIK